MQQKAVELKIYNPIRNQPFAQFTTTHTYTCGAEDVALLRKVTATLIEGLLVTELTDAERDLAQSMLELNSGALILRGDDGSPEQRLFVHPAFKHTFTRWAVQRVWVPDSQQPHEYLVEIYDQIYGGYLNVQLTSVDLRGLPEINAEAVTRFVVRTVVPILDRWVPDRSCFRY